LNPYKIPTETKKLFDGGGRGCRDALTRRVYFPGWVHPGTSSKKFDSTKRGINYKGELSTLIIGGEISPHSHINKALLEIL